MSGGTCGLGAWDAENWKKRAGVWGMGNLKACCERQCYEGGGEGGLGLESRMTPKQRNRQYNEGEEFYIFHTRVPSSLLPGSGPPWWKLALLASLHLQ